MTSNTTFDPAVSEMATAKKVLRQIVRIDEEKCDGCGMCVPSCVEGALRIVDGKAKLISETYCDGLGACLGECPLDAITIEEVEAEQFNEEAVALHLESTRRVEPERPRGCPGSAVSQFRSAAAVVAAPAVPTAPTSAPEPSTLGHWPVQLTLVPPTAPFLQGADVVLAAHCVPFAYSSFHQDFLKDRALLIACPKLDDFTAHTAKLTAILSQSDVKSVTVLHMEVPCCSGLVHMARQAIQFSGKNVPLRDVTIGVRGDVL